MKTYTDRFWKENWDTGLEDIGPEELETTYVEMIKDAFEAFPERTALAYQGIEITFETLDTYANQFANMLRANGYVKGDVVGINLPNIPQNVIALLGTLKAGCVVSGVSPLMAADQIKYQLNDLGSTGKKVALVTLDAIFAGHFKNRLRYPPTATSCNHQRRQSVAQDKAGSGKAPEKIPFGKSHAASGKDCSRLLQGCSESVPH